MPCYQPLLATRSTTEFTSKGKGVMTFHTVMPPYANDPMEIPCGQCIGCRLERSRQWAVRCYHEAQLHERNCFVTLTYDQENLPTDGSINVRHFQLFMKKLRKKYGKGIRYFHCGEYGEKLERPHYHAILFNHDFEDKIPWKKQGESQLYTSQSLERLWGLGFCSVGAVTFASAAYVARYITKKWTGPEAQSKYQWTNPLNGQEYQRSPEYCTMSRRAGIGKVWFDKYYDDVKKNDAVILNGVEVKPPKYYDKQMEAIDALHHGDVKIRRVREARKHAADNTPARLAVKKKVHEARASNLKRSYEKGEQ